MQDRVYATLKNVWSTRNFVHSDPFSLPEKRIVTVLPAKADMSADFPADGNAVAGRTVV